MKCPASCALASASHTGWAAHFGNENHEKIADGDTSRRIVAEVLADAEHVRHEVAYALDVETRTVRELGVNIRRSYGQLLSTEFALTVDLECKKGGTWWVVDWKSREKQTIARDNWQIRAQVMAVMGRHGVDSAIGALGYLEDNELDAAPFDVWHVTGFWSDLRRLLQRIRDAKATVARGEQPSVSAGQWCKYCPALASCPAHTRLALSLLGELESIDKQIAALTVEQAGRAWELLKRYDNIADRVKESIRSRATREIIPLTNGRRLALVESQRRGLDTKKAKEMLGDAAPYKTSFYTQVREVLLKEGDDVAGDGDR